MARSETVDDYVRGLSEPARAVVEQVLALVREVLPDAGEKLAYDIPTFTREGRSVVHVAGWAHHVSLYPVPDTSEDPALAADLAPYVAGKGTLRLDLDRPLPEDLIRRVVAALARRP